MSTHRDAIRTARSVVVKVGTNALTTPSGVFDAGRLAGLADAIEARMKAGTDARLERSERIGAEERKAARRQRREHGDEHGDDES